MKIERLKEMKEDYDKGKIVVCQRCGKVDINPYLHYKKINGFVACDICIGTVDIWDLLDN